jgi:hypothetical protein
MESQPLFFEKERVKENEMKLHDSHFHSSVPQEDWPVFFVINLLISTSTECHSQDKEVLLIVRADYQRH